MHSARRVPQHTCQSCLLRLFPDCCRPSSHLVRRCLDCVALSSCLHCSSLTGCQRTTAPWSCSPRTSRVLRGSPTSTRAEVGDITQEFIDVVNNQQKSLDKGRVYLGSDCHALCRKERARPQASITHKMCLKFHSSCWSSPQ